MECVITLKYEKNWDYHLDRVTDKKKYFLGTPGSILLIISFFIQGDYIKYIILMSKETKL